MTKNSEGYLKTWKLITYNLFVKTKNKTGKNQNQDKYAFYEFLNQFTVARHVVWGQAVAWKAGTRVASVCVVAQLWASMFMCCTLIDIWWQNKIFQHVGGQMMWLSPDVTLGTLATYFSS